MYTYMHQYGNAVTPLAQHTPSDFLYGYLLGLLPVLAVFALISLALKGYALWVAAKHNAKWWFIALLIVNTLGLLELVYLVFFSPKGSNRLNPSRGSTHAVSSTPETK